MSWKAPIVVCSLALLGTLTSTYPLLLGRSLVAPGNGPTAVLYDDPPFVYGASDHGRELVRGSDVGAMMWAILPYTVVQRQALAHGEFPLWNRYNGNGQPLWGQGQTFILDPVHLASLAIPDAALAMDLRFIAARAIFAAGAGVTVLIATASAPAAALVAAVAPFIGHFTSRLNHPAYFSIVYAPWILAAFAWLMAADTDRTRRRATGALVLACWLQIVGSTPKEGIVALVAAFGVGMVGLLVRRIPWRLRLRELDLVAAAGAIAVLLSAPHWLIFLDTLSRSWTIYSAPMVQFAGRPHAIAYALGAVSPGFPFTGGHALLWLAALAALVEPRRLASCPLGLASLIVSAVLAAAAFGAIPAALLTALPFVGQIHHVWDAFLAATLAPFLLIAGVGLASVMDPARRRSAPTLVAIIMTTMWTAGMVPGPLRDAWFVMGLVSVLGGGLALVTLVTARPSHAQRLIVALSATAAVIAGGLHLPTGIADLDAVLMQPRARARLEAASPAIGAIRNSAGTEPFRVAPVDSVLFPGTQAYWHLEGAGGPDALRLPSMDFLSERGGMQPTPWVWRVVLTPDALAAAGPFLDLLNVRYVVARQDQVPAGAETLPLAGADRLHAIPRPSAWPRAFFASGVERHPGSDAFVARFRRASGPFVSVDERDADAVAALAHLPVGGIVTPADGYVLTPNSTSFRIRASAAGIAVLSESFVEHDFRATVNGSPVEYYPVNHGFKGVVIPAAGEWTVRFEYRPRLWNVAWALAAIGFGALLSAWAWTRSSVQ